MKIKNYIDFHCNSKDIAIKYKEVDVSYSKLYQDILHKISILDDIKPKHIALLLPNSIEYIEWYYTVLYYDSILIPIYYNSSMYEIQNVIQSCHIDLIITYQCKYDELKEINDFNINFIDVLTNKVYSAKIVKKTKSYVDDTAIMLSTSGSFNSPKRVMLTNRNLISNANSIISSLNYTKKDIFLIILPLCFASANTSQLIVSLILGATVVINNDSLHPRSLLKVINEYKVTTLTVVPSIFNMIVNSEHFILNEYSELNTLCFGGGPTSKDVILKAKDKFNKINLIHMYGQTEASTRISHMYINNSNESNYSSVGQPLTGVQVRIIDEYGNELSAGELGEIIVKGDNVMLGYYNQPNETKNVLVDGWLKTGDIGMLNEDGLLFIMGRKKNIIIYSGINIYPEEIEDVIYSHPSIKDVLVYGKKDPIYGEIPIADIVLEDNIKYNQIELSTYCSNYLTEHKIPAEFNIVNNLTKTKNGKKIRKVLS